MAFDTLLYWPAQELPRCQRAFEQLRVADPARAERVEPYLEHLLKWDCRATIDSTETALCVAWYEELFGLGYPAERLKPEYRDRYARLDALVKAGQQVNRLFGTWKVRWGDVHRIQRRLERRDTMRAAISFNRLESSFPCAGAPGPLGVVFTIYSTPSIPLLRPRKICGRRHVLSGYD